MLRSVALWAPILTSLVLALGCSVLLLFSHLHAACLLHAVIVRVCTRAWPWWLGGVSYFLLMVSSRSMDSASFMKLSLLCWNVQGLGEADICDVVRNTFCAVDLVLACIQETKLSELTPRKALSFLPQRLALFLTKDADGSRGGGGIVTAWDPRVLPLSSSSSSRYSLTTSLHSATSALSLTVTNVYTPSDHAFTEDFVSDLLEVSRQIAGPWIVLGDFNIIRFPHEKNNTRFDASRATVFNSLINSLALHELALADRLFTWTNKHDPPTLARLDRVFFDSAWDAAFLDSSLSSRPRPTSDHVPLVVCASTRIPSSSRFFFENVWLLDPRFLPSTLPSWTNSGRGSCVAGCLAVRKKRFRAAAKVWKKQHRFIPAFDNDCKFLIDLVDFWEECRSLSSVEVQLRGDSRSALVSSIRRQSAHWK